MTTSAPPTMTPERWQAIDQILQGALVCARDHREEFVAHSCGNDVALRDEVSSLLAVHDASPAGFLERPTIQPMPPRRVISARLAVYAVAAAIVLGAFAGWSVAQSPTITRWVGALAGQRPAATSARDVAGRISPHKHWIAYTSNESGRDEVYVDSYPQPGYRIMISRDGGSYPSWREDGRELYYWRGDQLIAVPIDGSQTGRLPFFGPERVLTTRPISVR